MIDLMPTPSGVTITWIGGSNAIQIVESIEALTPTGLLWQSILTNLPPTTITNSTMDAAPSGPVRNYRIKAER